MGADICKFEFSIHRFTTRVGRMVMVMMMMPDRRLVSHGMKLEEEAEVVKAPGGGRVPGGAPLR